ncbi:MAG: acetyltransferase [bacterium]|nr:acetyltransferase [bacterium]
MKEVIIIGAGQNGQVVKNIISLDKNTKVIGFLDDAKHGREIVGLVADFLKFKKRGCEFFISVGDNEVRSKIFLKLQKNNVKFINAIHPSSCIESSASLGRNIMIGAFSYLNVNCVVGDNTFINNGCIIEHDVNIGAHCHLAPGVVTAGETVIGDRVFVGIGAMLRDRIRIGNNSVIGAGSNVVSDTKAGAMYYGNPAKFVKKL